MKTEHFILRQKVRAMDEETLDMILKFGRRYHRSGVIHMTVCEVDVLGELSEKDLARVLGWVVLISRDDKLITCYRSKHAHHEILRQCLYGRQGAEAA